MKVEDAGPSGERQPRRRRRRRWLALGCLVAVLALAYTARARWAGPLLAGFLERRAREQFGAELTIERVSGSYFRELVLEGVRLESSRPPLLSVEDARIEVRYWLLDRSGYAGASVRIKGRGIELAFRTDDAEPRRVELPELPPIELDLSGLQMQREGCQPLVVDELKGSFEIHGGWIDAHEAMLVSGANRLELQNASIALERFSLATLEHAFHGKLTASVADARPLLDFACSRLPLRSLQLELSAGNERAEIAGRAELEGGRFVVERGQLVWPETNGDREAYVDLALQADFEDLAPLGALLDRPLAGRWKGALDVTGPLRAPTGRFVGRGEALDIAGVAIDSIDVDVQTDGTTARFERCEISGPDLEAVLRGGLQLEPLAFVDVGFNLSADEGALSAFLPFPCEHAFVHARLDGPPAEPRGAFEASATGIELGRFRIDDAEVRGTLAGLSMDVPELRVTSGESFVEASGSVTRAGSELTATLAALAVTWREKRIELERGAKLAFGPGRFTTEGLELRSEGAAGAGRATITVSHADGVTRGALAFERYEAGPLLATFLPADWRAGRISGSIEGELGLRGDAAPAAAAPMLTLDLAFEDWSAGSAWPGLDLALQGRLADGVLALTRIELAGEGETGKLAGALRVPFDPAELRALPPGPVEIALTLESPDPVAILLALGHASSLAGSGPLRITAQLGGEWRALTGSLALEAEDLVPARADDARAFDVALELALADDVRLARGLLTAPDGTVAFTGAVGTAPDVARWLAEPWELLDAPLDVAAEIDLVDVGWIAGLAPGLRRVAGRVAGRVTVGGSVRDPSLGGALGWRGGEVRLLAVDVPLRALAADVRFDGDVVHVESLAGEVGGAPVRASGTIEPFGPFPRVNLELEGDDVLVKRDAHILVRADAGLVIKGTPDQLSIRGQLELSEGRYRGEISPLEELLRVGRRSEEARDGSAGLWTEGPLATAELDVHIGGPRTFEYRTNLLEASLRPDVWLRGTGAYPVLEGQVYVEDAKLTLPSGTLVLDAGLLTFRREAPLKPEASLKAEMRIQNYQIRATATGPLGALEISLSSTPPLPQDDLWVLFLSGQLPTARWQDRGSQAMEALAVFLARDTLVRWFSSEEDAGASLLERFEIDVGAKPSQSGQVTGRVIFYLKPQTRRSRRATYLAAELDEYDRVNFAFGIVFRPGK